MPMAVPKQEDTTTTSWRRERGPSRRSTAHRLRPLINRQDRIESSTAPACSSADTISRSHTAPKIMRLRYERRAPRFAPVVGRADTKVHRTQSLKTPSAHSRIWPRHTGRSVIFYAVCKRPWTLCEKVGSRCPPSAAPPGTKLGTAVDGVGGLRADRPARPSRPCLRRTGGAKIGLPLQWGLAPLILGKRLVWHRASWS